MQNIELWYHRYGSDASRTNRKWFINWLATKLTRSPYIHVEIRFIDGKSYAALPYRGVHAKKPVYADGDWDLQVITVHERRARLMQQYLDRLIERSAGFNYWGLYTVFFSMRRPNDPTDWFCSELCVDALAAGGIIIEGRHAHHISPAELYRLIDTGRWHVDATMEITTSGLRLPTGD